MRKPTVHLNGTGVDGLFKQYAESAGQLRKTIKSLQESAPHARDYYPQGETAYAEASKEHNSRIARIESVLAEIQLLAEHVADRRDDKLNQK